MFSPNTLSQGVRMHQKPFENALKRYLSATRPFLKAQALDDLSKYLFSPKQLAESPLLSDHHPLKQEARIISDAFEAVTNGMQTSEIFESLEDIQEDSVFGPWKELILGMHFYYEGITEGAKNHLLKISDTCALSKVKTGFLRLLDPSSIKPSQALRTLMGQIQVTDRRPAQALELMLEAFESSIEDVFWASWDDLIHTFEQCRIASLIPELTVWLWHQIPWQDYDQLKLEEWSAQQFGWPETHRLAALGCFGWDPEGALLRWGRFLLSAQEESILSFEELKAARTLWDDFILAVKDFQTEQGQVEDWEKDWRYISKAWNTAAEQVNLPGVGETWKQAETFQKVERKLPRTKTSQLDLFSGSE